MRHCSHIHYIQTLLKLPSDFRLAYAANISKHLTILMSDRSPHQELRHLLFSNNKVYIWQIFFYLLDHKSPRCTDMYSKEKFSIAIFLPRVLMYQKRQISLSVGYKTARPKTGHWYDCDVISGLQASRKTDFSVIFISWANQFAKKWYNSALFIRK